MHNLFSNDVFITWLALGVVLFTIFTEPVIKVTMKIVKPIVIEVYLIRVGIRARYERRHPNVSNNIQRLNE